MHCIRSIFVNRTLTDACNKEDFNFSFFRWNKPRRRKTSYYIIIFIIFVWWTYALRNITRECDVRHHTGGYIFLLYRSYHYNTSILCGDFYYNKVYKNNFYVLHTKTEAKNVLRTKSDRSERTLRNTTAYYIYIYVRICII